MIFQATGGLLTVKESANRLGLKEPTLRLWLSQRKLAYCKLGRCIRIPLEEVERLIRENLVPARGHRQ